MQKIYNSVTVERLPKFETECASYHGSEHPSALNRIKMLNIIAVKSADNHCPT